MLANVERAAGDTQRLREDLERVGARPVGVPDPVPESFQSVGKQSEGGVRETAKTIVPSVDGAA